jgi:hypothetical protein
VRITGLLVALLIASACGLALYSRARERPQDVPWTRLDLTRPIGLFTTRKLARLRRDTPLCRALLDEAHVAHVTLPPRNEAGQCGYADGIRLGADRPDAPAYRPASLGTSCAVAAALVIWEREIVQPAARDIYGTRVASIDHFGSYSCRRLYGRASGGWSEHATANAVDIAGFRLADGRRITVARDWQGDARDARFLHAVRDGACRLFATTLSPDYNAAHRDHFHLDQADRGMGGWRACR